MTSIRPRELSVRDLMTTKVFTLTAGQSLTLAENAMRSMRVRHIPVVDDLRRLVGLVTHRDLLSAKLSVLTPIDEDVRTEHEFRVPVAQVMQENVWTIAPDAPALSAAKLLEDHKFGCLPVVRNGRLVGIVTEHDLMKLLTDSLDLGDPPPRLTVGEVMSTPVEAVKLTQTLSEARAAMALRSVRHLPIVDDLEQPLGVISDRDLQVAEAIAGEASDLTVGLLGSQDPFVVSHDAALGPVLLDMASTRIGSAVVVDGTGRVVGILTQTDATRMLGERLLDPRPAPPPDR